MKISSKGLAIIIIIIMFGGIILSNNLGWWNTSGGQGQGQNRLGQAQKPEIQTFIVHYEEKSTFDGRIKGNTTFQDLLEWGMPRTRIEEIIDGSIPDPTMQVREYCEQKGLSFGHLKRTIQDDMDKISE